MRGGVVGGAASLLVGGGGDGELGFERKNEE